jgi:hypothetical protein
MMPPVGFEPTEPKLLIYSQARLSSVPAWATTDESRGT